LARGFKNAAIQLKPSLTPAIEIGNYRGIFKGVEELRRPGCALGFHSLRGSFFVVFAIIIIASRATAQDCATLIGRVLDSDGNPLANAHIEVASVDGFVRLATDSREEGSFHLGGIRPGSYSLRIDCPGFQPSPKQAVEFEESSILFMRVSFPANGGVPDANPSFSWIDLTDSTSRTIINAFQVQCLPSANNVWSVIENQDFSATTNRIDVGGVWADRPALWSSRGSVSWTQSSYLINGLDATDPYATGTPLFYPDLEALQFLSSRNARQPIAHLSPGGTLNLVPKQGTSHGQGAVSLFFTTPGMTSGSVSQRLHEEGLSERTRLNSLADINAQFSGPVFSEKIHVFTSFSHLSVNRDVAEFSIDDKARVSSALANLTFRLGQSFLQFFWTGQEVLQPTAEAARDIPFSATLNRKSFFNVFQGIWRGRVSPGHYFELGAAFNRANIHSRFEDGVREPHGLEVFKKIPSGAAALAGRDDRTTMILQGKGQALFGRVSRLLHRLDYGFCLRRALSSSEEEILGNIHLHYMGNEPFEMVRFSTPVSHREKSFETHLFIGDDLIFANLASLSAGLHLVSTRGQALPAGSLSADSSTPAKEGGKIRWLNLAPRLSLAFPFLRDKSLTVRVSAGRYFFHLPLQYLSYGNPDALGGQVYRWTDPNNDLRYEPGEEGELMRREGPFYADIDPAIKRPYADEYVVSFTKTFPGHFCLTLAGYYRETRRLVETQNIGVPLTAYSPVQVYDAGDDAIPGNHDDIVLTVYNQNKETLGDDFFLLTNPDEANRVNRYRGLDLTLVKKFGLTVFFFAATATEAIGTSSPGNTESENDDGVIGTLYDNPNAFISAKGRLRFDRAYTARLGVAVPLPFGFRLAGLAKYYDGQPFSRKIIVTGLNQGPFYVQAWPRAVARYEFNMTVDLRLEKAITIGKNQARLFLDAYNIFNWALATEENEWTGPEFTRRYATEVQSPRVVRMGMRYEF